MGEVKSYRDLLVWQKGIALVKEIYRVTKGFPADELYGLTNQLRKAAVSVPSNIAEGQARQHTTEFLQFISHSRGSLAELHTQLIIAKEVNYITQAKLTEFEMYIDELQRMLNVLCQRLNSHKKSLTPHHSPLITKNGFTLVEVLVAIAVIALTTVMLLGRKTEVMREASRTRDLRIAWQLASQKMGDLSLITNLFQGELVYTDSGNFKDKDGNDIDYKYELEVTTDNIPVNAPKQEEKLAQLAHLKLRVVPPGTKDQNDYIKLEAFYPVTSTEGSPK